MMREFLIEVFADSEDQVFRYRPLSRYKPPGTYTLTLHEDGRAELRDVQDLVESSAELVEKLREYRELLVLNRYPVGYFDALFKTYLTQPEPPQQWHDDWFF